MLFSAFAICGVSIANSIAADAPLVDPANRNCSVDIASTIPTSADWSAVYIVRAEDGSAWQRAPLRDHHQLLLSDTEMAKIEGTASSNSEVQLFIYAPRDNGSGGLQKPAFATCLNVGKANQEGGFNFEFNSKMLWEMLGQDVIIDAFYKMGDDWEKIPGDTESQNFFIGTHSFPSQVTVEAVGDPKKCPLLCNQSNMVEGVSLDPLLLDPKLLGKNFDEIGGRKAIVARAPGEHTFYAGSAGDNARDREVLTELTLKSLSMERLKRTLMANPNAGNRAPGIDPLTPEALRDAAAGKGGSSKEIQQLIQQLRTVMTDEGFKGDLKLKLSQLDEPKNTLIAYLPPSDALLNLPNTPEDFPTLAFDEDGNPLNYASAVQNLGGQTPTGQTRPKAKPAPKKTTAKKSNPPKKGGSSGAKKSNGGGGGGIPGGAPAPPPPGRAEVLKNLDDWFLPPAPQLTAELFPPNASTNETWPEDLLNMINFWTGGLEKNDCLALDDPQFQKSIEAGKLNVDADYVCQYSYIGGLTPQILLNSSEEVLLEPNFADAKIVEADVAFSAANGWNMAAGKKDPISYRYEFSNDFSRNRIADLCVQKSRLSNVVDSVAHSYHLTAAEKTVLASELNKELSSTDANDFVSLKLANPIDVAERFIWNGNGKQLDILGLFFEVDTKTCNQESTSLLFSPQLRPDREGFEVGILK